MRRSVLPAVVLLVCGVGLAQDGAGEQRALEEASRTAREDPERALQAYRQLMGAPGVWVSAAAGAMQLLAGRLGRPQEAIELYDELAARSEGLGVEGLAYGLVQRCDPGATRALIGLLADRTAARPGDRDAWVLLANARGHAQEWNECVAAWQRVVAHWPGSRAQRELARALLGAGRYEEALAAAEEVVTAYPFEWYWIRLEVTGPALVALGRLDDARELADELADERGQGESGDSIVRLYQQAGAHEQAIALLQRLIETAKPETYQHQQLMRNLAAAYEAAGEPDKAYQQYKAAAAAGDYQAANLLVEHYVERLLGPTEFDSFLAAVFNEEASTYRWRANEIWAALDKAGKSDDLLAAIQAGLTKTPDAPPLLCLLMYGQGRRMQYAAEAETAGRLYEAAPDAIDVCTVAGYHATVGDYATALQWIERGDVSQWPIRCGGLLVKCCRQLGCMDKLEGHAARIREAPGDKRRWAFLEGDLWLEAGQAERAIPLLEAAKGLQEQAVVESDSLARAYAAANRVEDAVAEYEACLRGPAASTTDLRGLLQLFTQHYTPAQYVPRLTATLRLHRPLTHNPEAVCSLWLHGIVKPEQDAQRLPELATALEAECAADPTDPFAWVGLGLAQLAAKQPEAASASLAQVAALDGAGRIRQSLTDTYDHVVGQQAVDERRERRARAPQEHQAQFRPALEAGDCARAAELACAYLDCLTDYPLGVDMSLMMARQIAGEANNRGRADAFMAALRERLAANPEDALAMQMLVGCYSQRERDKELVAFLGTVSTVVQRDPVLCAALGDAHGRLGDVAEAERTYQHILELSPYNWLDALRLGWVYLRNQRIAEAEAWADKALEWVDAGHDRPQVVFEAARILGQCGAADKAARAVAKAVERGPESGWTLQQSAEVYRQLERWEDVAAVCTKALALEPRNLDRARIEELLNEAQQHGAQAAPR